MKVSERGLAFIAKHEGFVSRGYLDPAGIITIGYGFTMRSRVFSSWWRATHNGRALKVGDHLSRSEANQLLLRLLDEEYAPPVSDALPNLKPYQFDACVSVVYNLGCRALRWKWSKALKNGEIARSAQLLERTGTTANGISLPGLIKRRLGEARLLRTGHYGLAQSRIAPTKDDIATLQTSLKQVGFDSGSIDGVLGDRTRDAIRAFQRSHPPLVVDGIAGPATRTRLQRQLAKRKGTALAMLSALLALLGRAMGQVPVDLTLMVAVSALCLRGLASLVWRYRGRVSSHIAKIGDWVHDQQI
ncbi:peptidoglycan binding domain-containing protein [Roseibium sp. TrichSKD4]|uniref:glycoside hydrolase family protein n=1 Tax=Roseibium sp. TrichSKD4 TaxID=744980 RepID=UPI0001E572B2|nr:peptidoglycan-binding protein [Roseibium sp. TrichSKD4]EFO29090.1 peptidoglycan binding domain-containing protein [Roseibium sp. TrichSKD4]